MIQQLRGELKQKQSRVQSLEEDVILLEVKLESRERTIRELEAKLGTPNPSEKAQDDVDIIDENSLPSMEPSPAKIISRVPARPPPTPKVKMSPKLPPPRPLATSALIVDSTESEGVRGILRSTQSFTSNTQMGVLTKEAASAQRAGYRRTVQLTEDEDTLSQMATANNSTPSPIPPKKTHRKTKSQDNTKPELQNHIDQNLVFTSEMENEVEENNEVEVPSPDETKANNNNKIPANRKHKSAPRPGKMKNRKSQRRAEDKLEDDPGSIMHQSPPLSGGPPKTPLPPLPIQASNSVHLLSPLNSPGPEHMGQYLQAPKAGDQKDMKEVIYDVDYEGEQVIMGATLDKLVERLTSPDQHEQKMLYEFLLTYRSFCTPQQLLDLLVRRYNEPKSEGMSNEDYEKKMKIIHIRIFVVFKKWLTDYWYDFAENPTKANPLLELVRSDMKSFAEQLEKIIVNQKEGIVNSRKVAFSREAPDPILPKKKCGRAKFLYNGFSSNRSGKTAYSC